MNIQKRKNGVLFTSTIDIKSSAEKQSIRMEPKSILYLQIGQFSQTKIKFAELFVSNESVPSMLNNRWRIL
jgi:hypothetical protein